jgi:transcriptional regulator with XRE-family HTH domain
MKSYTDYLDKKIGQRVRYLRRKNNLTQKELALKLSISPQQLQKYEKGNNKISASKLQLVSEVLGLPVSDFFIQNKDIINKYSTLNVVENDAEFLLKNYKNITSDKLKELLVVSAKIYAEEEFNF